MGEHDVRCRLERRRQQARDRRLASPPCDSQHLDIAEGERERWDCRRIPGRRESWRENVFHGYTVETTATQVFSAHAVSPGKRSANAVTPLQGGRIAPTDRARPKPR